MENQINRQSEKKFRLLNNIQDDKHSHESDVNEEFDGTEAAGNDPEIDEEDYGKYHSGL